MDKPDNISRNRQHGVKGAEVQSSSPVLLRLRVDVRYITYGAVSGNRYEFNRAGSIVAVHSDDVSELLAKRTATSCCNGTPSQSIFELVGD